jgi:hypothetical protein
MLKYVHIAVIYLLGVAFSLVGAFECLLVSMALQVFAVATLIFKIIKQKGFKE